NREGETDSTYEGRIKVLLERVEEHSRLVSSGIRSDCPLSTALRTQTWHLGREGDAIHRCLQSGHTVVVREGDEELARELLGACSRGDRGSTFVCAPLKTSEIIGCLLVDNRFLPNQHDIDQTKIGNLAVYAEHISLYVENYQLRKRTQTRAY